MKKSTLLTVILVLLFTSCNEDDIQPNDTNLFVTPKVNRTVTQISLVDEMTINDLAMIQNFFKMKKV